MGRKRGRSYGGVAGRGSKAQADGSDSDEHELVHDHILLEDSDDDEGPAAKRAKRDQAARDALFEESEEEILGPEEDDDEEEEYDDADLQARERQQPRSKKRRGAADSEADADGEDDDGRRGGEGEEGGGDAGWWGSSRRDYYSADAIQTEADALEEEAEARRLQQKRLSRMAEADFFDPDAWAEEPAGRDVAEGGEGKAVLRETLRDAEIPQDMSSEDRTRLLYARYPELPYLAAEYRELRPLLEAMQEEGRGQGLEGEGGAPRHGTSLPVVKYRVLASYVAMIAMYFALLTSPARDKGVAETLAASELRDHEIMDYLAECRESWLKVKDLEVKKEANGVATDEDGSENEDGEQQSLGDESDAATRKTLLADSKADKKKPSKKARLSRETEESLADLSTVLASWKQANSDAAISLPKPSKKSLPDADDGGGDSDFGEQTHLTARAAAAKAARKKTLAFYAAEVGNTARRRQAALDRAGGDVDVPYRERLRDRQARLQREAERKAARQRRDKTTDVVAVGSGDDDDDDDEGDTAPRHRTNRERQDAGELDDDAAEDNQARDYFAAAAAKRQQAKAAKTGRVRAYEEAASAAKAGRVPVQTVDADGKRAITYEISKNRGLAPKRKKEARNPRVKKRMKYEARQKKLATMKPIYSDKRAKEAGKGGKYVGEMTGINAALVRARKL